MNTNYWETLYSSRRISNDTDGWLDFHRAYFIPGSAVLDLGCGAGTDIPFLLQTDARITAADFSPNAVETVQGHFGDALSGADCFDMRRGFPYGDGCFDAVVSDLSLHYFSWADTRGIIGEIRRILRQNGRLIARVHSLANLESIPESEIESHYYMMYGFPRRYFSAEEIQALFSEWKLVCLEEKSIHRYDRTKHVLEFVAEKI